MDSSEMGAKWEQSAILAMFETRDRRHVMRSFCRPCYHSATILPLSPSDGSNNLRSALILPTRHSRSKFQGYFNDEPRGPTAISTLQMSPPTHHELTPRTRPLYLRSRSATRSFPLVVQTQVYSDSLRVAKPTLNSITRAPTSSQPTGVSHTVHRARS